MDRRRVVFDDIYDAANSSISDSGKTPKEIAMEMRPDLKADSAKAWLHACLNHEKAEKFSFDQLIQFIHLTRRNDGTSALMDCLCDETGLERPKARPKDDEKAELQRAFIKSVEILNKIQERIEHLEHPGNLVNMR